MTVEHIPGTFDAYRKRAAERRAKARFDAIPKNWQFHGGGFVSAVMSGKVVFGFDPAGQRP